MIRREFLHGSLLGLCLPSTYKSDAEQTAPTASSDFPDAPNLTRYVAEFIVSRSYADLPGSVIAAGKKSILDGLGLALVGSTGSAAGLLRRYITSIGPCNAEASVLGTQHRCPTRFAALANGEAMHADDFDDTQISPNGLGVHPTSPVLPAALALTESTRGSGKDLMLAFHVGVEVETKITEALTPRNDNSAFHPTGTCGSFGSAAASAKVAGLNLEQTLHALGIAASEASGLRQNFGTMTKPLHAGRAAENGVVAAGLAALGWTASPQILEGSLGFFRIENDTFRPAQIVGRLGNPWTLHSPGVSLKPFPSGALTHPAMTELLQLIRKHGLRPNDIVAVEVGASQNVYNTLLHHHPVTGLQAKFSMEYCLAILLLTGEAGLPQFTDSTVQRADVQALMRRIHFHPDPAAEDSSKPILTLLRIELKDGQSISVSSSIAEGSPQMPMTFEDVVRKFKGCAEYANWPRSNTNSIVDCVATLEEVPDVTRLVKLLRK